MNFLIEIKNWPLLRQSHHDVILKGGKGKRVESNSRFLLGEIYELHQLYSVREVCDRYVLCEYEQFQLLCSAYQLSFYNSNHQQYLAQYPSVGQ